MVSFNYTIELRPLSAADGGGYLAIVPALPGCRGDGATPEEALVDVSHAISEWKSACRALGRAIPEPETEAA
jgi:antitoxin HicB